MPHPYLDLRTVPKDQRAAAEAAFDKRDAQGLMSVLQDTTGVEFVDDNKRWLQERGIYELCLFLAFTAVTTDLHLWRTEDLQALVDHADRKKLLGAGDSLPPGRKFTVYRGVAGYMPRHNSGPYWTTSLDAACWYALRHEHLYGPGVRVASLRRSEVIYFTKGRENDEFFAWAGDHAAEQLTLRKMQERAVRYGP